MGPTRNRLHHASLPCAAMFAIAALSGVANAQVTSAQQSAMRSSCRSDFMSHCSGVTPGGKDALACLQKNVARLSSACKKVVSETLPPPPAPAAETKPAVPPAPPQQAAAPAAPPAAAAAPPAPPAPPARPAAAAPPPPKAEPKPRPTAAAAKPAPAASAPATTASQPTAAQQSAMKSACRSDFTSHCPGVPPGGKGALACLQKNVATLSTACKKAVSATIAAPATAKVTPVPAPPPAAAPQLKAPIANAAVMLRACRRDLFRHCRGVEPGGGRELACLAAHESSLTIRCRTARQVTAPLR